MSTRPATALVIAAAALWGTTGTAQALGPDNIDPLAVGALRLVVAAPALWVVTRLVASPVPMPVRRGALLTAGAAMAAYQPAFFSAVDRTGVALGTLVAIGSAPILTAAGIWAIYRRPPTARWWLGTVLAGLGLALLLGRSSGADVLGLGLAVAAGASYAAYPIAAKSLLRSRPPVRATAEVFTVAAAAGVTWLPFSDVGWAGTAPGIGVVIHLGLAATAAAYALYSRLRVLRVESAATLSLTEPLVATILGTAVLGETLTGATLVGAGALALGLVVVSADDVGQSA